MAVYTEVSDDELAAFIAEYDIGPALSCKGIAEGVENTNYLLLTEGGPYILTLYEKRVDARDLPFFLGLIEHLADRGVPCPVPVHGRDGAVLRTLCERPAAITSFLAGVWPRRPRPGHCAELGEALARMHLAGLDYAQRRANALSVESWRPLFEKCRAGADGVVPGLSAEVSATLDRIEAAWPRDLPRGVVHADLFPDNVFFNREKLSGLIDFYFACNDALVYDLAVCLNAWCFESDLSFNVTKARHMIARYRAVRRCSEAEIARPPAARRGRCAALPADPPLRLDQPGGRRPGPPQGPARVSAQAPLPPRRLGPARLRDRHRRMTVAIYTDGACRGNPGPGGWGAVLLYGGHRREISGASGQTTNNRMELTAAIRALEALKRPSEVALYTDSTYVKDGITRWLPGWKAKGWRTAAKTPVKNRDLWEALDAIVGRHDVTWHWVKGHAGNAENERADTLARSALKAEAT